MRDYWRLGGLIYRELVVQAITQSRRTGARPTRIERVVDGYRVIKVVASIMMIMYLASPAITSALLRWRDPASIFVFPPYDYLTMYFTILLIYMLLSPLAISVMGNTTTGELLRILGFSERRIRLVSIIAVVRAVDAPLLTAMVLAITASIILRTPTPIIITTQAVLLGLMGPLLSVLALDTVISRGGSASGLWTRAFMVITNTATWVIALALLMLSEASPQLINPGIAQYIPLVGDPLIGRYAAALVNSVVTMTILLIIDAYLMGSAGTRLLMPRTPGGPESLITKRKPLGGFRFRGQFLGMVRYYMKHVLSARGSLGMVIGGLIMALFLYASMAMTIRNAQLNPVEAMIGIMTYISPMAFIVSFLPVIMYNAEYSALPIILTTPVTPIKRVLAKIPMVATTYYILTTPIIIMLLLMRNAYAVPAAASTVLSPVASTIMSAIIFELEVRDYLNGSQALAILNLINTLLIMTTSAIPIIAFITTQIITMNYTTSTTALLITGVLEITILTLALTKLIRRE
ncbi:hypothetical protein [Vulcanisaeta souniana]|uniref:Uncharacterized protein n=1 Tax=Vulcanisaeta souniana JCM 11219 TaxID=1293586 RepID=A0A830E254_9CREN|nr:hypothetical protein [Vulcanisaeta souniana]BDR92401.1 hypothetical protein Vsou_14940 [Vulcanisaeta souniana JCM 11219]GGI75287.1 hypothetical protein GCM10007112_10120 [Vulcanisaeta souniana JCM 11219]